MYHVTSSLNRASIEQNGLDVARMGSASGIAGSEVPEVDGCFLCVDQNDIRWFVEMNSTGGGVDVWEVDTDGLELVEAPEGYPYYPGTIPPWRLRLMDRGLRQKK
ncbi:MAG TPA: hypothetical protein VFT86_02620 [Gaiellaceae bacterium]|nr:hypothetical protein [Gaiellaceae bacterium]